MPDPLISLIDDDELTLLALAGLLRSFGFETQTYGSAEAFIQAVAWRRPAVSSPTFICRGSAASS